MPKISKIFLEKYDKALHKTLNEYMASKPNYSDEGRVKLTLQFILEFNHRLLSAIDAPYLNKLNSKKRELIFESAASKLLLATSEPDCENGLDYSKKMLTYYQNVAQNLENDPLKEYHDDLRSSLVFYKPAAIITLTLLLTCFFLFNYYAEEKEGKHYPNKYFLNMYLLISPFAIYFNVIFSVLRNSMAYSEKALKNLESFAQQKTYALPGTNHVESVEHIKGWFEDRNVFFQPSMAEVVDKNREQLSLCSSK